MTPRAKEIRERIQQNKLRKKQRELATIMFKEQLAQDRAKVKRNTDRLDLVVGERFYVSPDTSDSAF